MKLIHGDCLEKLKQLEDNSVDSVVTDPPYGISFMGKKWDYDVPSKEIWEECLRVLKPGGYLLSFSGSRTYHRMAVNIEDAGFEIRDQIMWVYGSGFPKNHNISIAIDKKLAGMKHRGKRTNFGTTMITSETQHLTSSGDIIDRDKSMPKHEPMCEESKKWEGWGTNLKPSHEPIVLARKPISEKTIAENVLKWGTGSINIDGCRVGLPEGDALEKGITGRDEHKLDTADTETKWGFKSVDREAGLGRFPANFLHDGSKEVVELFPEKAGNLFNAKRQKANDGGSGNTIKGTKGEVGMDNGYIDEPGSAARFFKEVPQERGTGGIWSKGNGIPCGPTYDDDGSAARFFYCPKANKKDRNEGMPMEVPVFSTPLAGAEEKLQGNTGGLMNTHPTVKPTALMAYLCRLVTQPGGVVLDPFMGSGSTGKACKLEGFDFIGIEREEEYYKIAEKRCS